MSSRPKAVLSWSTGKDSAFALWEARKSGEVEIVALLTTVTTTFGRVSMHGVREDLLDQQAAFLGKSTFSVMPASSWSRTRWTWLRLVPIFAASVVVVSPN